MQMEENKFPEEELQEVASRMEDVLLVMASGPLTEMATKAIEYCANHLDYDRRVILDMADLISALAERLWNYEPGFDWNKLLEQYQSKPSGVLAG